MSESVYSLDHFPVTVKKKTTDFIIIKDQGSKFVVRALDFDDKHTCVSFSMMKPLVEK